MFIKIKHILTILILVSFHSVFGQFTQVLEADYDVDDIVEPKIGLGISFSTFGVGPFVFYQLKKSIRLKANANYIFYNYSLNKLLSDLEGTAKLRIGGIGIFSDWYFYKVIYVTGGISTNFNSVDVNEKMANYLMIGDIEMTPDEIGRVGIKLEPAWALSPYIGIGGGRKISVKNKFGYSLEIGTFFQGLPKVELSATGMLSPTASKEQEKIIENNIKPIDFWPKVAINIMYRIK